MACYAKFARNNALHEYLPLETLLLGGQDFSKSKSHFNVCYNPCLWIEGCCNLSLSGTQAADEAGIFKSSNLLAFSPVPLIPLLNC